MTIKNERWSFQYQLEVKRTVLTGIMTKNKEIFELIPISLMTVDLEFRTFDGPYIWRRQTLYSKDWYNDSYNTGVYCIYIYIYTFTYILFCSYLERKFGWKQLLDSSIGLSHLHIILTVEIGTLVDSDYHWQGNICNSGSFTETLHWFPHFSLSIFSKYIIA